MVKEENFHFPLLLRSFSVGMAPQLCEFCLEELCRALCQAPGAQRCMQMTSLPKSSRSSFDLARKHIITP